MEKYEIISQLGSGTFGVVCKAFNKQTYETVAIKKLLTKYESSNKTMMQREVKALVFNNHENIIKLKDLINENNTIFLVFECMQGSLHDLMVYRSRLRAPFSEAEVRHICFQIFRGLACLHRNGYLHRDLKPANVLVSKGLVKISDFGAACEIDDGPYTDIVTTSWYRAPEVFLHSESYNSAVDMWAMGAIMFELLTFRPLFQGSSDPRVFHRICFVLGAPTKSSWFEGLELARNMKFEFPKFPGVPFSKLLPMASPEAVDLIGSLLSWSPHARPTAMEALHHPFFGGCYLEDTEPCSPLVSEKLMEKNSSLRSCERVADAQDDDLIRMLPENPFEFMMEKNCEVVAI